jgi:hypothetical protein
MAGNVDTLKEGYAAFGRGDLEGALENFADDIRWEGANTKKLPGNGVHEGKEAVGRSFQETVSAWDKFTVEPDEFIEDGDTVVALGHGQLSKDGRDAQVPFVHVWRFEGGKVKRAQVLTDTAVAVEILEG